MVNAIHSLKVSVNGPTRDQNVGRTTCKNLNLRGWSPGLLGPVDQMREQRRRRQFVRKIVQLLRGLFVRKIGCRVRQRWLLLLQVGVVSVSVGT
jgi:hypothetical protein